jgi:hypothetical protein
MKFYVDRNPDMFVNFPIYLSTIDRFIDSHIEQHPDR